MSRYFFRRHAWIRMATEELSSFFHSKTLSRLRNTREKKKLPSALLSTNSDRVLRILKFPVVHLHNLPPKMGMAPKVLWQTNAKNQKPSACCVQFYHLI